MINSRLLSQLLLLIGASAHTSHATEFARNAGKAAAVLDKTIQAIGGTQALNAVNGLQYHSSLFRSQTLTQSYDVIRSDQGVAQAGSQSVSFSFTENQLKQRIDRKYQYGDYWIWAFPHLQPDIDYSMVVQSGPNGFACFNKGQNSFFAEDPSQPLGFADPFLADYLIHSAQQLALPHLLKLFLENQSSLLLSSVVEKNYGAEFTTLQMPGLDLLLLIDRSTFLPFAVRAPENHLIFGPSTSDMIFFNYSNVSFDGHHVKFPHRIQTLYNTVSVIEDFTIDELTVNPKFEADFFSPSNSTKISHMAPRSSSDYPRSEVHEFFETGLWGGPFGEQFNSSSVQIAPVFPNGSTPEVMNLFVGYPDYIQMLVEMEDGFIITDAPAFRSSIVVEWVKKNMGGKKVTHVVPSHHHRDHAGGVGDILAAGAALVIPEVAKPLYANVNGGDFKVITYNEEKPFVLKDRKVQFASFWHPRAAHAEDWVFSVAAPACWTDASSEFALFNADVVSPGSGPAARWDTGYARGFLLDVIADGIPKSATLIGAHGSSGIGLGTQDSLAHIAELAGVPYPDPKTLGQHKWCY
ncbi:hypothetical protein TASIC1_0017001300 [Trichoderma asperellum]|uniref:Metallo-beta-lactamase domain-containing protein n=1 Tax=Trichoderma asperellum TaxID=101201 RepID=A0A6V8R5A5_TRIAP|nr:hypothetical protein TASIC1_0017001300 [Trichoderma asperellum]